MALLKPRQFWDTQPVPKLSENFMAGLGGTKSGALETKTLKDVRKEPYPLLS